MIRPLPAALVAGVILQLATTAAPALAQSAAHRGAPRASALAAESRQDADSVAAPIRDNSFLVEEAYNQDPGTVQHINAFTRAPGGDWAYSLTEEWAVRGQRHQLGATVLLERVAGDSSSAFGFGDLAINYRHQLVGLSGGPVAVAPRLTLLVPTGDASRGLGAGRAGLQLALPLSIEAGPFVTHLNASVTRVGVRGDRSADAATVYALGESVVWLAARRLNLLVESVWTTTQLVDGAGNRFSERELVLSPGVRWSHDLPRGLQIVPGVAVPIGIGPTAGDRTLLLYLSLEHPY